MLASELFEKITDKSVRRLYISSRVYQLEKKQNHSEKCVEFQVNKHPVVAIRVALTVAS